MRALIILLALPLACTAEVCGNVNPSYEICNDSSVLTRVLEHKPLETLLLHWEEPVKIASGVFQNVSSKVLSISFANLTSLTLTPDSLEDLTAEDLYVHNASFILPEDDLIVPDTLKTLTLDACGTSEDLMKIIQIFTNIDELNLYGNSLPVLPSKAFASMQSLQKLSLVFNGIVKIEADCFDGLNDLIVLNLSYNNFSSLPAGVFSGLANLKQLYIDHCYQLKSIDVHVLRGMPVLDLLGLQNTALESLQLGMFDDLRGLAVLLLESTNITHVPKGVFNKIKTLRVLCLKNSNITSIEPSAFSGLNLESLNLSGGLRQKILQTGIFNGLTVQDLYLRSNGIQEIKPDAWDGLFAESVIMGSNNLTNILPEYFAGLNTTRLSLMGNGIAVITPRAFQNTRLEEIDLRDNNVKTVEKATWGLAESVKITIG